MNAWGIAVTLSIAAAALHAAAAVFQERLAGRHLGAPKRRLGTLRLLWQAQWWWAVVMTGIASLVHVAALHYGPLTVVQPLGALTLVLALSLSAAMAGRRVSGAEWLGAGLTMAGLALLLHLTTADGPRIALSPNEVLVLSVLTMGVMVVFVLVAMKSKRLIVRSQMHAMAAGVAFGVASAMARTVTIRMSDDGWEKVLTPASAVMVVLAFAGLLLAQAAYRAGIGAPLATLTIINPIVAAVIGMYFLGERFEAGAAGAVVAAVAGTIAACGIVVLARHKAAMATKTGQKTLVGC